MFSAVIAYGLLILSNQKAPEKVKTNLTGMINRRPELIDYAWIADYSEQIVKFAALINLLAVACIFSYKTNCIITLNIVSILLTTWLLYNPFLTENPKWKEHMKWVALKNIGLVGGLLFMKL